MLFMRTLISCRDYTLLNVLTEKRGMTCCCGTSTARNALLVTGAVLLLLGAGCFFLMPAAFNFIVRQVCSL